MRTALLFFFIPALAGVSGYLPLAGEPPSPQSNLRTKGTVGRSGQGQVKGQNYKPQQYWTMSPGTEELIDRMQPERVRRLERQSAKLYMSYQGQGRGQVRSPKVITNYLFNGVCAAYDLWVNLFIECNSETQKVNSDQC